MDTITNSWHCSQRFAFTRDTNQAAVIGLRSVRLKHRVHIVTRTHESYQPFSGRKLGDDGCVLDENGTFTGKAKRCKRDVDFSRSSADIAENLSVDEQVYGIFREPMICGNMQRHIY